METATLQLTEVETAVAVPSEIFQQAEAVAKKLGLSRSEFYVQALKKQLQEEEDAEISRRLNEIYEREDSSLDPVLMQMQIMSLEPEEW